MTPSTARLSIGLKQLFSRLGHSDDDTLVQLWTASGDMIARWLHNGADVDFLVAHHDRGLRLLREIDAAAADALPASLDPRFREDILVAAIAQLAAALGRAAKQLLAIGPAPAILTQISDWEHAFYLHRDHAEPFDVPNATMTLTAETIQAYLRRAVAAAGDIMVEKARTLVGGYGRATVMIQLDRPLFGTRELVMRAEIPVTILALEGFGIAAEFEIIKLAHRSGVAAPTPLQLETGDNETGTRFILVNRLPGSNVGSLYDLSSPISDRLLVNLVRGLVQIHAIDPTAHPDIMQASHLRDWMNDGTMTASILRWVDCWENFWHSLAIPSPTLERLFHWLRANVPQSDAAPVLLHSDYGLGNLLIENDELTAVLDWEASHMGHPAEEVGWLAMNLRGKVDKQRVFDLYEEFSGRAVDLDAVRYFDAFANVKLLVSGMSATRKFADNPIADPIYCRLVNLTVEPSVRRAADLLPELEG